MTDVHQGVISLSVSILQGFLLLSRKYSKCRSRLSSSSSLLRKQEHTSITLTAFKQGYGKKQHGLLVLGNETHSDMSELKKNSESVDRALLYFLSVIQKQNNHYSQRRQKASLEGIKKNSEQIHVNCLKCCKT